MPAAKKRQKNNSAPTHLKGSFRDPAGYMYRDDSGKLRRHITPAGMADYTAAKELGLYKKLSDDGLLVRHREVSATDEAIVIAPDEVPVISYPFERSFSMLRDAALATLAIQKQALAAGMTLKDASAYNIQFVSGKPLFIDTLSFELYRQGEPWAAYGQFCRHFLAPLALMAYTDLRLGQLLREYIDGVPLDLAAKLLPRRARYKPSLLMHVVMHAKAQESKSRDYKKTSASVAKTQLLAIIDSLERSLKSMRPESSRSEWMDYYENTNYTDTAAEAKQKLIAKFTKQLKVKRMVDIGGNDGHYSRAFSDAGIQAICADIDPHAVEYNYRRVRQQNETHMLPLLVDVTNPGGGLGWANEERGQVHERLQADLAMALAIIHHLCISNNLPFTMVAEYFARFAPYLIIEFVPKEDSQVQKLLATRKDIFPRYTQAEFEKDFTTTYALVDKARIAGTKRTLYLFRRKKHGQK
jgi:hypothetical protein